jgi:hypothetical protein
MMFVGTCICFLSVISAISMVIIMEYFTDPSDPSKDMELTSDEKFHLKDLTEFGLPFWL